MLHFAKKGNKKAKHFTVIALKQPICWILLIGGGGGLFHISAWVNLSKKKFGDESDGEEYFYMNAVSDKYHTGGSSCTYKGGKVPCLV